MKILIYGTGGVGGYYGARLAEAGNDVTFIARGKHLEAIQKKGLQLKSIDGNYTVFPVNATHSLDGLSNNFDLIILGVKSWQISSVSQLLKPFIGIKTLVLPLQNGANNIGVIQNFIDSKNILAGLCKIYAKIDDYGVINHFAHAPEIIFGEINNEKSARILKIQKIFLRAKFNATIPEDIHAEIWKKFMFICTVSGLGGLTRVSIGEMVKNKETHKLLRTTAEEIFAIAVAKKVNLSSEIVDGIMNFIEHQPFESTASTQRDIMACKPSELENFNGFIVKQGQELGIKTPVNKFIYESLLPQERKARNE